jgi:hypothetical protein
MPLTVAGIFYIYRSLITEAEDKYFYKKYLILAVTL